MRSARNKSKMGISVVIIVGVLAGLFTAVGLLYLYSMSNWSMEECTRFAKQVNNLVLYRRLDAELNAYVDEGGGLASIINTGEVDAVLLDMFAIPVQNIGHLLYRRIIVIENGLEMELRDYQVKIILSSPDFNFSRVKPDGSDIRFYSSGGMKLNYWIEKWDPVNGSAVIWVKVPSIPGEGRTSIYMYYGDPDAKSESCGDCVFELFDDFTDGLDSADWKVINAGAGSTSLSENGIIVKSDGDWSGSSDGSLYLISREEFDFGYVVETLYRENGTDSKQKILGLRAKEDTDSRMFVFTFDSDASHITNAYRVSDGANAGWYGENSGKKITLGWKRLEFKRLGDKVEAYVDDELVNSKVVPGWDLKYVAITDSGGQTNGNVFKHIFVRKFEGEDPSVNIGGESVGHPMLDLPKYLPANFTNPHVGVNEELRHIPVGGVRSNLGIKCITCEGHTGDFLVVAYLIPEPLYDKNNPYKNSQYVKTFYHLCPRGEGW